MHVSNAIDQLLHDVPAAQFTQALRNSAQVVQRIAFPVDRHDVLYVVKYLASRFLDCPILASCHVLVDVGVLEVLQNPSLGLELVKSIDVLFQVLISKYF